MKTKLIFFAILILALASCQEETNPVKEQMLSEGWTLTGDTLDINLNVSVPSVVQTDLFDAGIISDPYLGQVENDLLWISDRPWKYTLHFDVDREMLQSEFIDLVFEGIDTYADVVLNGQNLFHSDNMFRSWTIPLRTVKGSAIEAVRDSFQEVYPLREIDNVLEISFPRYDSTLLALYDEAVPRFPEKYAMSRKAAYQHGWDWAPKYKNVGVWKPVKLVGYSGARIATANVVTKKVVDTKAEMKLMVDLQSRLNHKDSHKQHSVTLQLFHEGNLLQEKNFNLTDNKSVEMPFVIDYPKLWWPNEMGGQPLYDFEVCLTFDGKVTDRKMICTGIKTFEMIQEPDAKGSSFYFKVNGQPMYAKGANYIPQDNFTSWMNPAADLDLLQKSKEAHFNMLRVWGGGIYPYDYFFDICDSLGILVWEDFMYAGTMYPYDADFLNNVTIEAEQQVKRLASHPSLALWCGGNEISEGYYNWGWQQSLNWSEEDDKAMKAGYDTLFERILPRVVAECDGTRPYWPSSPSKGWGRPESLTEGDVHYWGVWWGEQPYEIYREKVGRFNSEYGYQSYPDITTLQKLDTTAELSVGCDLIEAHQKHGRGTKLIDVFIKKYYPDPVTFADYVYMSQLSQAYGMEIAIEAHRKAKPYNMGTLYWQLNDSWPVVSWSSIDHYGKKKALQYKLNALYAPVLLSLNMDKKSCSVSVTSDLHAPIPGNLKTQVVNFNGEVLFEKEMEVIVADFQNVKYDIEGLQKFMKKVNAKNVYVKLELTGENGLVAERYCYLVYPKDLNLPQAKVDYTVEEEDDQMIIELTTDVFAKDVQIYALDGKGSFSDNFFDLGAGETKRIVYKTEKTAVTDFAVRCLNDF